MAFNLNFNPNCGACGGLNSRGYCSYTACRFPVTKVTAITNQQPKTNADRIRSMTDEELANLLAHKVDACHNCSTDSVDTCVDCWLEWLKKEDER